MDIQIKKTKLADKGGILELYQSVSEIKDGLIRRPNEIHATYIETFLERASHNGLSLIAQADDQIVGEMHAYTPNLFAFQHILTDLTIVVHPDFHGKGIGRQLFNDFLNHVREEMTHISRIELFTREDNVRNVKFYESLGFQNEGRQRNKIFKGGNEFETPIHMAWLR